jgi:hypothetical protein
VAAVAGCALAAAELASWWGEGWQELVLALVIGDAAPAAIDRLSGARGGLAGAALVKSALAAVAVARWWESGEKLAVALAVGSLAAVTVARWWGCADKRVWTAIVCTFFAVAIAHWCETGDWWILAVSIGAGVFFAAAAFAHCMEKYEKY